MVVTADSVNDSVRTMVEVPLTTDVVIGDSKEEVETTVDALTEVTVEIGTTPVPVPEKEVALNDGTEPMDELEATVEEISTVEVDATVEVDSTLDAEELGVEETTLDDAGELLTLLEVDITAEVTTGDDSTLEVATVGLEARLVT